MYYMYNGVFTKMILIHKVLWKELYSSNDDKYFHDFRTEKQKKEAYDICYKFLIDYYNEYILDNSWRHICKENPGFDSDKYHKIFNDISYDDELISERRALWIKKFEAESRKNVYGAAVFELQCYFDDVLKIYGDYYWIENVLLGKPMLNSYSSFYKEDLMECESDDLLTILQKYENGELTGKFNQK